MVDLLPCKHQDPPSSQSLFLVSTMETLKPWRRRHRIWAAIATPGSNGSGRCGCGDEELNAAATEAWRPATRIFERRRERLAGVIGGEHRGSAAGCVFPRRRLHRSDAQICCGGCWSPVHRPKLAAAALAGVKGSSELQGP
ncbi:unnamed protein product [Cuscuta campestris]|uniref:Uncharacterized protein n=1 Tax=Cuscuta campestris TaxID=132261 RepID=A0A484L707_9ASTE|nr:unnamed protein product [Cuscuta campestris]